LGDLDLLGDLLDLLLRQEAGTSLPFS
jgi:hypothetical protein